MKNNIPPLAERRERLLAQAAQQRATLAHDVEPWRIPLALADQGLNALRYIKRHPVLLIGGVAVLAMLRPDRGWRWLRRGWLTWQVVNRLRRE